MSLGLRETVLDLLQRCIWKASGVGCVCRGPFAYTRGPWAVRPERGTQDLASSSLAAGTPRRNWNSVPLIPPRALMEEELGEFISNPNSGSTRVCGGHLPSPPAQHGGRGAAAEARRPGPFSRQRSELAGFSILSAVWPWLRELLQLPTCPERPWKFPDLSKPRWPKLFWVTGRPSGSPNRARD